MKKIVSIVLISACVHQYSHAQDFASLSNRNSQLPASIASYSEKKEPVDVNTISIFNVSRQKNCVELTWQPPTSEEKTVFIVERRSAKGWEKIARVPCIIPTGEEELPWYTYYDENSSAEVLQYRIREVAKRGKERISEVRPVAPDGVTLSFAVSNIAGKIRLGFATNDVKDIQVLDEGGALIHEVRQVNGKTIQLPLLNVATLSVIVTERASGAVAVQKVKVW